MGSRKDAAIFCFQLSVGAVILCPNLYPEPIMRALLAVAILILVSGCDAVSRNDGPLALGIVSGNNQTAVAGSERLTDAVVGKLVRKPDGGITFNLVTPAYAQGAVVQGAPVPGALVCAVSISEDGMIPWVPCAQTDSAGTATFFFTPGTKADTVRSEIRGTVNNEPAVFDTAVAVVEPSALAAWNGNELSGVQGDTLYLTATAILQARDEYHNPISAEAVRALPIVWTWIPYRTGSTVTPLPSGPPADAGSGWSVPIPANAASWKVECPGCSGEPEALLVAWIDGVRSAFRVHVDAE